MDDRAAKRMSWPYHWQGKTKDCLTEIIDNNKNCCTPGEVCLSGFRTTKLI